MMELDLERVRANAQQASTEDLLDRATVFRDGMEPEALEIIARATVGRVNFKVSGEGGAAARINLFAERLVG